ncbi:MAG: DUF2783 domain-containing protein [Limnohabitans sp.]|jgi:hypothetical protein|nr:DUF2783 domain-containing protein [Limnohabitans sp.]
MSELKFIPNLHFPGQAPVADPAASDEFYECLMEAHQDLSEDQSHLLNARLILLLANQVGDVSRLKALIATAREDVA